VQIDQAFLSIATRVAADPLLRSFAEIPDVESTLQGILTQLDTCQAALHQFLELKRSLFPR
jgi:hypothetical protein